VTSAKALQGRSCSPAAPEAPRNPLSLTNRTRTPITTPSPKSKRSSLSRPHHRSSPRQHKPALRPQCPCVRSNKLFRSCRSANSKHSSSSRIRNKLAFRRLPYEMCAASGCCSIAAGFGCGRMSAKPKRKIKNAASIPNAIAPRDAQINIAKSSRFAILTT
jgi:hypothetical protein